MEVITEQEEQRFQELCTMAFNYARNNERDNLETMLKAGLNPNLKTAKGDTLLMLASYHNSLETSSMLLEMGASVDEPNDRGQTPLAGVCFKGYIEMAKLLVQYGANIDRNNGLGMTPYGFAVMFGHHELAEFLLSKSQKSTFKKGALGALKFFSKIKKKNKKT